MQPPPPHLMLLLRGSKVETGKVSPRREVNRELFPAPTIAQGGREGGREEIRRRRMEEREDLTRADDNQQLSPAESEVDILKHRRRGLGVSEAPILHLQQQLRGDELGARHAGESNAFSRRREWMRRGKEKRASMAAAPQIFILESVEVVFDAMSRGVGLRGGLDRSGEEATNVQSQDLNKGHGREDERECERASKMEVDEEDGEECDVRRAEVETVIDRSESLSSQDIEELMVANGEDERDEGLFPAIPFHRGDAVDHLAHVPHSLVGLEGSVSSHEREETSNVDLQRECCEGETDACES
jgi:hypothetical protein